MMLSARRALRAMNVIPDGRAGRKGVRLVGGGMVMVYECVREGNGGRRWVDGRVVAEE